LGTGWEEGLFSVLPYKWRFPTRGKHQNAKKKNLSLKSGEAAQETLLLASESSDCGILCIIINSDVRKLPVQLAFMALSTGLDTHRFCPFSTRLSAVLIAEATVN
jgi:hypothetical protein